MYIFAYKFLSTIEIICLFFIGGANSEHSADRLLEWTSKRTWKDRRRASKARNGTDLVTSDPELIFYGRHSGVVGLCRNQLFRRVDDNEPSTSGYDKVSCYQLHIRVHYHPIY